MEFGLFPESIRNGKQFEFDSATFIIMREKIERNRFITYKCET